MPLSTYTEVGAFITKVLTVNNQFAGVAHSPHKDFWNTMSEHDFETGNIPNVTDSGQPLRIMIPGNSAVSNIILALRGQGIFSETGSQDRMPANGPPYFTDDQIKQIADWIDSLPP
jgi:hypothetical protein